MARAHRMQLWDCVVCAASVEAGAGALVTEDMQDGRTIEGLRLINPFAAANAEAIETLLGGWSPQLPREGRLMALGWRTFCCDRTVAANSVGSPPLAGEGRGGGLERSRKTMSPRSIRWFRG